MFLSPQNILKSESGEDEVWRNAGQKQKLGKWGGRVNKIMRTIMKDEGNKECK